jgi:hypothetical protein
MARRRRPRNTPAAPQVTPTVLSPSTDDVRAIFRDELSKALALPPGAQATEMSPTYLNSLQRRASITGNSQAALPRSPYNNVAFGPGEPLLPAPVDPAMASGRPAPRRWDYPNSWNLNSTGDRLVPFSVLRDAADQVSVVRSCIEVRKSEMVGLQWSFGVNSARARQLAERSGSSHRATTADLQERYADDIERLHRWWTMPDRINGWSFSEWLSALMEDQLVIDAVPIYPHLTFGGELHSAELIDGATIRPLLDWRGATPQPPYAAYQQILSGFPRGEFQASPGDLVDAEFVSTVYGRSDESVNTNTLIYKVRSRRSAGPYGFSCVEQALADVDLWLKRFDWLRSEFSAGVTPEMLVQVDAPMTPEQLRQYEAVFNDDLSGRSSDRHRAKFMPAGFNAMFPGSFDAKFSSDFDFHLVRLMCAAFDVLPTSIGFTPNQGTGALNGATEQQRGERVSQLQRATKPTAQWVTDLINEVSAAYLGMPPEITFRFHGLDEDDEEREAGLRTKYLGAGAKTLNEVRDELNLPRYTFPAADQPYLITPTGPAWINVDIQPVGIPGNLPSHPGNGAVPPPAEPDTPAEPAEPEAGSDAEKTAEAAAFRRWVRKAKPGRRFELHHLGVADLDTYGISPDLVKAAGDPGKAPGP